MDRAGVLQRPLQLALGPPRLCGPAGRLSTGLRGAPDPGGEVGAARADSLKARTRDVNFSR